MAASEKRADREPNFVRTVRSLQSSLASTNREIWRIFGEWEARILYSLDCVAERVGFESEQKLNLNELDGRGWHAKSLIGSKRNNTWTQIGHRRFLYES